MSLQSLQESYQGIGTQSAVMTMITKRLSGLKAMMKIMNVTITSMKRLVKVSGKNQMLLSFHVKTMRTMKIVKEMKASMTHNMMITPGKMMRILINAEPIATHKGSSMIQGMRRMNDIPTTLPSMLPREAQASTGTEGTGTQTGGTGTRTEGTTIPGRGDRIQAEILVLITMMITNHKDLAIVADIKAMTITKMNHSTVEVIMIGEVVLGGISNMMMIIMKMINIMMMMSILKDIVQDIGKIDNIMMMTKEVSGIIVRSGM
mmetsp:Transcript_32040/g.42265  ORF Transcript_32040/g.42265 Transcript_32040/m.42265 type:complete len:261 (-) Transcript_32040:87-869(-)